MKLLIVCCLVAICAATSIDEAFDRDLQQWSRQPDSTLFGLNPKLNMYVRFRSTTGSDGYIHLKNVTLVGIHR